jgi:O-antigen/teichoic acid export membrane protein
MSARDGGAAAALEPEPPDSPDPPRPGGPSAPQSENAAYGSGARVLTIGIASTGIFTFLYLATASHVLGKAAYSRISICWAIMFVILSVIYRPIEQLLSRTIADRAARGLGSRPLHVLRAPAIIQASFALLFLAVSLALHGTIERRLFAGSSALYWILVVGVLAYAGSYFARGWLAGHQRFALYGGLVFLEATSRFLFALAVAVGIGSGQGAVGLGMAVAPFVSLTVIPFAFARINIHTPGGITVADAAAAVEVADAGREGPAHAGLEEAATDLTLRHGTRFAVAVVAIMFSEQTLMNAGVIVVAASSSFDLSSGLTGFVFNVLLIVRAPLQLFQAVQTSILPHLTKLAASDSSDAFDRAIRLTLLAIAAFAGAVALGLLAIGPFVMKTALGSHGYAYGRLGLAAVGVGMGLHLAAGTLNQALLARGRASAAALCWLVSATVFVLFTALHTIAHEVERVEVGYLIGTLVLSALLAAAYRRTSPSRVQTADACSLNR